jgi:hypothetical protein
MKTIMNYIIEEDDKDYGNKDSTMYADKMADKVAFCIEIKVPQTFLKFKEEAHSKANRLIDQTLEHLKSLCKGASEKTGNLYH